MRGGGRERKKVRKKERKGRREIFAEGWKMLASFILSKMKATAKLPGESVFIY